LEEVRAQVSEWREALADCAAVYVSGPRAMLTSHLSGLDLQDPRVQRVPFGLPRVTLAHAVEAANRLSTLFLHRRTTEVTGGASSVTPPPPPPTTQTQKRVDDKTVLSSELSLAYPEPSRSSKLLLEACERGDEAAALALLEATPEDLDVDAPDVVGRRALHLAAAAKSSVLVRALLGKGADPATTDDRDRVPYFFAADRKTRDAFRAGRADVGEDGVDWAKAGVPDALDAAARAAKRAKDADKKKRQRERQKQAKADQAAKDERRRKALEEAAERKKKDSSAPTRVAGACDHCGKPILGPPFTRLDFKYCSTACVAGHRRALMAQAAEKRLAALQSSAS